MTGQKKNHITCQGKLYIVPKVLLQSQHFGRQTSTGLIQTVIATQLKLSTSLAWLALIYGS